MSLTGTCKTEQKDQPQLIPVQQSSDNEIAMHTHHWFTQPFVIFKVNEVIYANTKLLNCKDHDMASEKYHKFWGLWFSRFLLNLKILSSKFCQKSTSEEFAITIQQSLSPAVLCKQGVYGYMRLVAS